jgi:hypothetical protein
MPGYVVMVENLSRSLLRAGPESALASGNIDVGLGDEGSVIAHECWHSGVHEIFRAADFGKVRIIEASFG